MMRQYYADAGDGDLPTAPLRVRTPTMPGASMLVMLPIRALHAVHLLPSCGLPV